MKTSGKMFVILCGAVFAFATGLSAAQTSSAAPNPPAPQAQPMAQTQAPQASLGRAHRMTGTVVSVNDDNLVLSHGRKDRQTTFEVNPATRRKGEIVSGEKVVVRYHRSGKDRIATSIAASKATTKATAS